MRIPYGTIAVIQVDQLDCTELQMQVHQPDQELASFAIVTGAIKVGDAMLVFRDKRRSAPL